MNPEQRIAVVATVTRSGPVEGHITDVPTFRELMQRAQMHQGYATRVRLLPVRAGTV